MTGELRKVSYISRCYTPHGHAVDHRTASACAIPQLWVVFTAGNDTNTFPLVAWARFSGRIEDEMRQHRILLSVIGSLLVAGCNSATPFEVSGVPARSFSLSIGGEIGIQMATVGPGEYVSPPTLTGSALQFLEVTPASGTVVPSGVQQVFHFKGVAVGQTIIVFHHTNPSGTVHPDVIDTVNVR